MGAILSKIIFLEPFKSLRGEKAIYSSWADFKGSCTFHHRQSLNSPAFLKKYLLNFSV